MSDKPRFDLPDEFRHAGVTGHMPITTTEGRVVYNRKKHFFKLKDITRIWERYLENLFLPKEKRETWREWFRELRLFWYRFMEGLSERFGRDLFGVDWDTLEQLEWEWEQLRNETNSYMNGIIEEIRIRKIALLGIPVEGEEEHG